jgi:hypothetical protein
MAYLQKDELETTYYPKASAMDDKEVGVYLARANAYAYGVIGGELPAGTEAEGVKVAVAMAFEIFAKGETAQVNDATGDITLAAPSGKFTAETDPLTTVKAMLKPYAAIVAQANTTKSERGLRFL